MTSNVGRLDQLDTASARTARCLEYCSFHHHHHHQLFRQQIIYYFFPQFSRLFLDFLSIDPPELGAKLSRQSRNHNPT